MTRIIDNDIEMTRGDTAAIQLTTSAASDTYIAKTDYLTATDDDIIALFTGL